MDIELRPATAEDLPAIVQADTRSFGFSYSPEQIADLGERGIDFLVATDRDRVVGVGGAFRFELTVPGGAKVAVPGITWVSVLPTHRRRGVLSSMMARFTDGYRAAGDPCAVLTASEGGIYRRFGYGVATRQVTFSVQIRQVSLRTPVDSSAVEFLSLAEAREQLPELHREWERTVAGALGRDSRWWHQLFQDPESERGGKSERCYLAHPGGYLAYRIETDWKGGHFAHRCHIVDYKVATAEAHAALWQVLLGMDLFVAVESSEMPADDPLPFLVDDFRQVRVTGSRDGLWLRPVDIPALLAARRYLVDIEAVLEVDGESYLLSGGPDGAECVPTGRPADVVLDRPTLGSVYLGGYPAGVLARAGLLRCGDPGLLRRFALAFGAERAPVYGTNF